MTIKVFESIGETWESAAKNLVDGTISNIISSLTPVITTGIIIYFIITGYMVIAGRIQEPIGDVLIKAFKLTLVATLFTQAGTIAVNSAKELEEMFTHAITNSNVNIYQLFDKNLDSGAKAAADVFIKVQTTETNWIGMPSLPMGTLIALMICAIIIMVSTILITILGAAIYIMTKTALLLAVALSPFFIAGLFFPITARWFDSWLSQIINYAMTGAIIVFFSGAAFAGFDATTREIANQINAGASFPTEELITLVIYGLVSFFSMKQAPSIASGLAGGVGVSGVSLLGMAAAVKQAGQYVGGTISRAKSLAGGGTTTKRDHVTGENVRATRLAHLARGRTIFNSGYRESRNPDNKNRWGSNKKPEKPNNTLNREK